MHIGFLSLAADHFLDLIFNHGTQGFGIHDLFAPKTFVNTFPNRDEASKMSDLGADHLFVRISALKSYCMMLCMTLCMICFIAI